MSDIARLLHFVERKNPSGVEEEIEGGADVNQREASTGKTALHFAAGQDDRGSEESSVKIVQILLKAGSDVNSKDKLGNTPLQLAHSANIARALLRAGADPTSVNEDGQSVLEYAQQYHPMVYEVIDGWHSGDSLEESFGALRQEELDDAASCAETETQLKRAIMDGLREELARLDQDAWQFAKGDANVAMS